MAGKQSVLCGCFAALGLALALAGCGPDDGLGEESFAATTRKGVDYSWYRPSPASLAAQGYTFAARYLSHDTTGKNLSKTEADALIAAGLDVVSNWEEGAQDALSGYNQGVSDAQAADSQATACGAPTTRPIYFSVDFDGTAAQQPTINSYFDGVASVIGLARTGAYGGYYVVQRLFDAGKIKWAWQAYAWSGGQWDARAQMRQIQNGIAGGEMDEDESVADDFGQWGHSVPQCNGPIGHPLGSGGKISGTCGGAAPNPPASTACGALASGQGIKRGESVESCDHRFNLIMQTDGNVVLYANGIALWSTVTAGTDGAVFVMQTDGNLVLYSTTGCPLWASNTAGKSGATLAVQTDGNLVVYSGSTAIWASGSGSILSAVTGCGSIPSGHALEPGGSVSSCGGCFDLVLQSDGNLVLYQKGGKALWSTGTNGQQGYAAEMLDDGDFTLYSNDGCVLWESGSKSNGASLAVQDDGNLVVYSSAGAALWSSGTNVCKNGCYCNPDAGAPPAGPDAGKPPVEPDAGKPPAERDAGHSGPDAGAIENPDAGSAEADAEVAGEGSDAAAQAKVDAGKGSESAETTSGCGCGTSSGSGLGLAGALALAALLRRRRPE